MSTCYGLGCKDCKQYILIGQVSLGGGHWIYSSEREIMTNLQTFLLEHQKHCLVYEETGIMAMEDYEEIYERP